jgi:Raf kinase inhibitor-like YbhB/YbcL family protein
MRIVRAVLAVAATAGLLAGCSTSSGGGAVDLPSAPSGGLTLTSTSFTDGGPIPTRYTCDGQGLPPDLSWSSTDPAAEFVLVMIDPDAPGGTFVHWVMYAIPADATNVGEGQGPPGARQGVNGFGSLGYGPPCPPQADSLHHYVFTMYALTQAKTAELGSGATLKQVVDRIRCCVQASATITGTVKR